MNNTIITADERMDWAVRLTSPLSCHNKDLGRFTVALLHTLTETEEALESAESQRDEYRVLYQAANNENAELKERLAAKDEFVAALRHLTIVQGEWMDLLECQSMPRLDAARTRVAELEGENG